MGQIRQDSERTRAPTSWIVPRASLSHDRSMEFRALYERCAEAAPYATYEGDLVGEQLGQLVAALGDINLDGINDLAVGARPTNEVNLYLGAKPCLGDMNGDGAIDLQDIALFSNAFPSRDLSADLNGDGAVDLSDIVLFSNALSQGCS